MLKILQVHNRYVWSPGGEISVLEAEADLLREYGHDVHQFFVDNKDEDSEVGLAGKLRLGKNVVWSHESYGRIREAIAQYRPDIVHVHNFFVHISPSVYKACNDEGVAVVQTLHNFRTCCAEANLLRDNRPCQDCIGKFPVPALKHRCYRGSLLATLPLVAMQQVNRWNGSFTERVDGYIVLSEFAKEIFVRSGLPEEKIHIKANFAADSGTGAKKRENRFVFVGRIVEEKGPEVMVDAWMKAQPKGWTCHMLGEGDLRDGLMEKSKDCPSLIWHGWVKKEEVEELVRTSKFMTMSSVCYEGCPLALIEALSFGTPGVIPNHGPMPEIAQADEIGLSFQATNSDSMAEVLTAAANMPDEEWNRRSIAARSRFESNYTASRNYQQLIHIYEKTIESARESGHVR
ncbi:glycosyltransferase family 4 protein [Kamptonema cortianum]|nr:glycosyltransferase family 4 protein [Geitlerinema splendidum]MDK3158797.1 glycosyltransferase family 4 protein [Kamptonema cortianum]